MTDPAGIPALQDAIRHLEGVEARHIETVPVHETQNGQTVWQGEVEVFDLVGHPKAKRAYAWSHATEGTRRRFHVVLHSPPVDGTNAVHVRTSSSATPATRATRRAIPALTAPPRAGRCTVSRCAHGLRQRRRVALAGGEEADRPPDILLLRQCEVGRSPRLVRRTVPLPDHTLA
jgi:hypothetical protein